MTSAQCRPTSDRQALMARVAANFPASLRQMHQWVLWKRESRGDNTTKVPYQPNGQMARSTDSSTWSDFQTVEAAFLSGIQFDGVGFVFTEADPYVGIDLDKCRDPLTGEVEPWAADVLARLGTYTELSPSGKGFHVIGQGRLPPAGRRKDGIEMYDAGRYFTVTGDHYGDSPSEAADIQAPLMALHAEVFAKPAKTAPRTTPQAAANDSALTTLPRLRKTKHWSPPSRPPAMPPLSPSSRPATGPLWATPRTARQTLRGQGSWRATQAPSLSKSTGCSVPAA